MSTRLAKAERGECEALVLARAGLLRLGLESRAVEVFEPERILPAVGQGVVAVEVREGHARARDLAAAIDHTATRLAVTAERALLARLEGGCQVPIGALAACAEGGLRLDGLVADLDGRRIVRASEAARVTSEGEALRLGERVAARLLAQGAAGTRRTASARRAARFRRSARGTREGDPPRRRDTLGGGDRFLRLRPRGARLRRLRAAHGLVRAARGHGASRRGARQ